MKELTDKLRQAEKELEEADKKFKLMEANANRLLIEQQNSMKETSYKLVQTENQPQASDAEKNLKEADEKFKLAEAEAKSQLIDQQKSL